MRFTPLKHPTSEKRYCFQDRPRYGHGLRASKIWDPVFFQKREFHDRPFRETITEHQSELDALTHFLHDTDATGASWEVEKVKRFLRRPAPTADARIWLDCRIEEYGHTDSSENAKHESRWLNAANISDTIPPSRIQPSMHTNIHRCLTFVPNLTPGIVTAMVNSSSCYQAQTLRKAIRGHVAGKTSIRVTAPPGVGSAIFRLEFHLPYLALKHSGQANSASTNSGQSRKLWSDLTFLPIRTEEEHQIGQYSILADHTSVVISGAHHFDWYGFAFGNPGPRDPVAEEYEFTDDAYNDESEEGTDDWYHAEVEDFFAAGGCQSVSTASRAIMDPRVYFLRAVQHRLDVVVQSHEYLVQKLEEGFHVWVKERDGIRLGHRAIPDHQLEKSLYCIGEMTKIFRHLRQRFSKARGAWERFNGPRGDVLYFEDLRHGPDRDALHKIEESFETLSDLEITLKGMLETCSESATVFALHLRLGKHGMSRVLIDATADAAASALKSERFAEETSRATRVNVQLLMVTTAVVIALQYFCSDRALFAFERNPRTFWISIFVLVPGLLFLTFVLNALDHVKIVYTNRLTGKLKEAATPKIERASPA